MQVDILTTFPNILDSYIGESMMKQAQIKGLLEFRAHNLRDWTHDAHKTTDDCVFGGGAGLVMKCEPIFECLQDLLGEKFVENKIDAYKSKKSYHDNNFRVVMGCPQGRVFDDKIATELSKESRLIFICGHYEGIDERVYCLADDLISVGDFILTSGELSALVMIDAIVRKIPGVLGAEGGAESESFVNFLLEHPQYTRPADYKGLEVPEVLRSGNKKKIDDFNLSQSLKRTWESRPDLIEKALKSGNLDDFEINKIVELKQE